LIERRRLKSLHKKDSDSAYSPLVRGKGENLRLQGVDPAGLVLPRIVCGKNMITNPRATLTNNRARQVAVSSRPAAKNQVRQPDPRVQAAKSLMESNAHGDVTIGEMAKIVGLSPGRFARLFKEEIGISPQCYLDNFRLETAKQCLETSGLSIKEIGASVGIPNLDQFCRNFKARYGLTPKEYRKLHCA
jgi:transcriptional regulator GlxA family with amidase domain